MRSDRSRASTNDRPNVLAAQRPGERAWDWPVYDLHALEVAGRCHDLEKRTVKGQRALDLCKVSDVRLAQKLRLLAAGTLGVDGHSLAWELAVAAHIFRISHDTAATVRFASEAMDTAREHHLPQWLELGERCMGWAMHHLGDLEAGLDLQRQGVRR
jgi:hypothetical protein